MVIDHDGEARLAGATETVARQRARGGAPPIAYVAAALVVAVLVWYVSKQFATNSRTLTDKDSQETFRTAQTRDLAFQPDKSGKALNKIVFTPPPEPTPAPAVTAPSVIVAAPDDSEARRLAAEEAERLRRLRSPMMVLDQGDRNPPQQSEVAKVIASGPEEDANRRFVNQASNSGVEVSKAERLRRTDALIPQGFIIRGLLETAIQSDLPGMVRAITSEDVYSFDGRRVLIPKGTMLTGEYRSGLAQGQTRVLIAWTRMLRSDGVSLALGSFGSDDLGRSGLTGDVDRHYVERFGSAILLSLVGGVSQYIAGLGQNYSQGQQSQTTVTNPVTGQTVTTVQNPTQNNALLVGSQQSGALINQLATEALKDSVNIPPTIYVDQGTPIIVLVRRDLDFSGLYTDPVKEALLELKRHPTAQKVPAPPATTGPVYKP